MRVQTIDMTVTVGGTPADDDELHDAIAIDEAQLDHMVVACLDAVQKRHRPAWSRRAYRARVEQFEREMKGIIKRWVSTTCEVVTDADTRKRLRVRQYGELALLMRQLSADTAARLARRRMLMSILVSLLALGFVASSAVLAVLLYG